MEGKALHVAKYLLSKNPTQFVVFHKTVDNLPKTVDNLCEVWINQGFFLITSRIN